MTNLFHLIYISRAADDLAEHDIHDILAASRDRNAAEDVTGLLLYSGARFVQILEGREEAVERIYASIQRDPRHRAPTVLVREDIEARGFSDWSMGFKQLPGGIPADVEGLFVATPPALKQATRQSSEVVKSFMRSFMESSAS